MSKHRATGLIRQSQRRKAIKIDKSSKRRFEKMKKAQEANRKSISLNSKYF